ncbi:MAG: YlxR family protein, partial [Candidatus Eremiobacteraeota bacterium]|nr:YlxR family protein [Candidatus Eremiobacteraeota bacterium]MBC5801433.1 YlxR family protein [Candidatus Eremiobacteraeota bacterium]MBC5821201.1 YlxR family protein [Candidatus Eremiobacteraeota bacterium]
MVGGRHVPLRTCVGCRTALPQAVLTRFVRDAAGWSADPVRRRSGRGVYLCSASCARHARKNRRYPGLGDAAEDAAFPAVSSHLKTLPAADSSRHN